MAITANATYRREWLAGGAALLLLLALRLLTDFNGLYGQDSYAYLAYAEDLRAWWAGGPAPGEFFWPETYPLLGALLSYLTGDVALALQAVSMLALAGTVVLLAGWLRRLYPDLQAGRAAFAFLALALSPFLLRNSLMVMSDSLAVFWGVAALQQLWGRPLVRQGLAVAALCVGLAVMTRYAMAVLLLPALLVALAAHFRLSNWRTGALTLALTLTCLLLPTLPHFALTTDTVLPSHHFLSDWSFGHWFMKDFEMADGHFSYGLINIIFAFGVFYHPGFLGLLVAGVVLLIWRRKNMPIERFYPLMPLVMLYLLFIAGIPFQNPRFLLPVVPLVLLAIYPAVHWGFGKLQTKKWLPGLAFGAICSVHLVLGYQAGKLFLETNRAERQIGEDLRQYGNRRIYTFALDGAVRTYARQLDVVNMWGSSIKDAQSGELVLFNAPAFREQWAGQAPMQNWNMFQTEFQLDSLRTYPRGWTLYELR